MHSNSLSDTLDRVESHLRDDHHVDVGLSALRAAIDTGRLDHDALVHLEEELAHRRDATEAAREHLERLLGSAKEYDTILRFTSEGWAWRRSQLVQELEHDRQAGLASWLNDWYCAAAGMRMDALERLNELELPAGAALLCERARIAYSALRERNWYVAEPFLRAGADGLRIDGREVPDEATRRELTVMLARLAVLAAPPDEMAVYLDRLDSSASGAMYEALRARAARRLDESTADDHARAAREASPTDLDAAIESLPDIRAAGTLTSALDMAGAAVDGIPSLLDIDAALSRLLVEIPAEIWLAVAQRAAREENEDLVRDALDAADDAVDGEDYSLRATIAEERIAALAKAPLEERVDALLAAGNMRLWANEAQLGRDHYEHALALQPANGTAMLGVVSCLHSLSAREPASVRLTLLERALDILARVADDSAEADRAWRLDLEASVHTALADSSRSQSDAHRWEAFLAVARYAAGAPDNAYGWSRLVDTATELDLFNAALAFGQRAAELDGDTADDALAQALCNAGRFDECLSALADKAGAWRDAVRAYTLAATGHAKEALSTLEETDIDPAWKWAREVQILLRILSEDRAAAASEASELLRSVEGPLEEAADRPSAILSLVVVGRIDDALRLGGEEDADERGSDFNTGAAFVLAGAADEGLRRLRTAASRANSRDAAYWQNLQLPAFKRLAQDLHADPSALKTVRQWLTERLRTLEAIEDPLDELSKAPPGTVDPELFETARDAATALVEYARGDTRSVVSRLTDTTVASDADLRELRTHAEQALEDAARAETTRQLVEAAFRESEQPRSPQSVAAVRKLLELHPWDVLDALWRVTDADGIARVRSALEQLRQDDSGVDPSALLDYLSPPAEPVDERPIVQLPPSWFEGHDHPVNDHPLFLRYLPELRVTLGEQYPGFRVRVDEALEPDRYRIERQDTSTVEGHADPRARWAQADTLAWLTPEVRAAGRPAAEEDLVQLPADLVERAGPLAELLTFSPLEMVVRAIRNAVGTDDRAPAGQLLGGETVVRP